MDFFIADTHLGHANVIKFDRRPYSRVKDMDDAITENWNSRVSDSDDVYILGDFSWSLNKNNVASELIRLNGKKHLILGNHDKAFEKNERFFLDEGILSEIVHYKEIPVGDSGCKIVLCHYPIPFYRGQFYGWYHFYGHVHVSQQWSECENIRRCSYEKYGTNFRMLNVGCMMSYMDYGPRSFEELDGILRTYDSTGSKNN